MHCRLCSNKNLVDLHSSDERKYYLCPDCKLISVPRKYFLSPEREKERYLSHNNSIEQQGYVDFLNRAIEPALPFLNRTMLGLDYGCGYAPTVSEILAAQGFRCEDYDPFFIANDLTKRYDFIFSTEVFEHFFNPQQDIKRITELLKPGGLLVVMTEKWQDAQRFDSWYYKRDPAHVAFYHDDTFAFISERFAYHIIYDDGQRVVILRKDE